MLLVLRYLTNKTEKYLYCINIISQNRKYVCEINSGSEIPGHIVLILSCQIAFREGCANLASCQTLRTRACHFTNTDCCLRPVYFSLSQTVNFQNIHEQTSRMLPTECGSILKLKPGTWGGWQGRSSSKVWRSDSK